MDDLLFLIPALPLLAAVVNFVLGKRYLGEKSAYLAIAAVGVAFVLSLAVFADQYDSEEPLKFIDLEKGNFGAQFSDDRNSGVSFRVVLDIL